MKRRGHVEVRSTRGSGYTWRYSWKNSREKIEILSFTALLDFSSMTSDTREDYLVAQRIGL